MERLYGHSLSPLLGRHELLHRFHHLLRRLHLDDELRRLDQVFDYVRKHNEAVNRLDFITGRVPIKVDYALGSVELVEQRDGCKLAFKKITADYEANDRLGAMSFLQQHAAKGEIVTSLLYVGADPENLRHNFNTVDAPLNSLGETNLCPGSAVLEKINASPR